MWEKLKPFLPHAPIVICNMYIVFYLIDLVNQPMNFIDNRHTKELLLILCALAFYVAAQLLRAPAPRRAPARPDSRRYGDDRYAPAPRASDRYAARAGSRYGDDRAPARRSPDSYGSRYAGSSRASDRYRDDRYGNDRYGDDRYGDNRYRRGASDGYGSRYAGSSRSAGRTGRTGSSGRRLYSESEDFGSARRSRYDDDWS